MLHKELQCVKCTNGFNYGRSSGMCNNCHKDTFGQPAKLIGIHVAVDSELYAKLHVLVPWGERNILINKFLIGLLNTLDKNDKPTKKAQKKS